MIYLAKVCADLIRKEKKSIEDVPENLREEVQQLLGDESDAQ